jgi:hypothetical protein
MKRSSICALIQSVDSLQIKITFVSVESSWIAGDGGVASSAMAVAHMCSGHEESSHYFFASRAAGAAAPQRDSRVVVFCGVPACHCCCV